MRSIVLGVLFGVSCACGSSSAQQAGEPRAAAVERATSGAEREREDEGLDHRLARIVRENGLTGDPSRGLAEPSRERVHLGRALFFDKILGGQQDMACASCHHPATATGDDLRLGRGFGSSGVGVNRLKGTGPIIPRNAPPVWNAALFATQFWDGRVAMVDAKDPSKGCKTPDGEMPDVPSALTAQAMFPVTSFAEMRANAFPGMNDFQVRDGLAARVAAIPEYRDLFRAAFGDDAVTPVRIATAISDFETHLSVVDTPWFAYVRGDRDAISHRAKRGAVVFYEKARCQSCHAGDLGTDLGFHNVAIPQFGPGKGDGPDGHDDFGRARVTKDPLDRYKFRTPTMINVALHAPYGHDGAYESLESIVRHHLDPAAAIARYDDDADTLPPELKATLRDPSVLLPTIDPLLAPMHLRRAEVEDLLTFLRSQTDPRTAHLQLEVPLRVPSGLPVDR